MTPPEPATSLPTLLRGLTSDPGRPRLTWYGAEGERVELSGHVLDNWVTKTANLLVEEYDAGPWTTVLLDLGPHWRSVVWALAAWRTGACVVLPDDAGLPACVPGVEGSAGTEVREADVVVTTRPQEHAGTQVVAVALPALARAFDGPLPAGATDAAAAVMTYGDVLTYMPDADPTAPALVAAGTTTAHGDLLAPGRGVAAGPGDRVLHPVGSAAGLLRRALDVYASGGSLVLLGPGNAVVHDGERLARLVATERVTVQDATAG